MKKTYKNMNSNGKCNTIMYARERNVVTSFLPPTKHFSAETSTAPHTTYWRWLHRFPCSDEPCDKSKPGQAEPDEQRSNPIKYMQMRATCFPVCLLFEKVSPGAPFGWNLNTNLNPRQNILWPKMIVFEYETSHDRWKNTPAEAVWSVNPSLYNTHSTPSGTTEWTVQSDRSIYFFSSFWLKIQTCTIDRRWCLVAATGRYVPARSTKKKRFVSRFANLAAQRGSVAI